MPNPDAVDGNIIQRDMSEKDFQSQVISMAEALNWRVYHTYDSRRSQAGFPDLCMVRNGVLIYAELKREGRYPTRKQHEWIDDLKAVSVACAWGLGRGVEVYVWRPRDIDEIEEVLR